MNESILHDFSWLQVEADRQLRKDGRWRLLRLAFMKPFGLRWIALFFKKIFFILFFFYYTVMSNHAAMLWIGLLAICDISACFVIAVTAAVISPMALLRNWFNCIFMLLSSLFQTYRVTFLYVYIYIYIYKRQHWWMKLLETKSGSSYNFVEWYHDDTGTRFELQMFLFFLFFF